MCLKKTEARAKEIENNYYIEVPKKMKNNRKRTD